MITDQPWLIPQSPSTLTANPLKLSLVMFAIIHKQSLNCDSDGSSKTFLFQPSANAHNVPSICEGQINSKTY